MVACDMVACLCLLFTHFPGLGTKAVRVLPWYERSLFCASCLLTKEVTFLAWHLKGIMPSCSSLQEECAFEANLLVIPTCRASHPRVALMRIHWDSFRHLLKPEDALQEHSPCAAAAWGWDPTRVSPEYKIPKMSVVWTWELHTFLLHGYTRCCPQQITDVSTVI